MAPTDKVALLNEIDKVRETVTQLTTMPRRVRSDTEHALQSARAAGDENDNDWLFDELNKAQELLLKHIATAPEAKQLADTVGAIIQRAMSLFAPQQPTGRSHNQNISGNAQAGVAVSGDVQGGITYQAPGSGAIAGDYVAGDKVAGDKVMGDKQVINNHASNQGAQGTFNGPVYFGAQHPADTSPNHIQGLIDDNMRRLRVLEQRAARYGYNTPPEVVTEIEDIRAEIARLEAQRKQ